MIIVKIALVVKLNRSISLIDKEKTDTILKSFLKFIKFSPIFFQKFKFM